MSIPTVVWSNEEYLAVRNQRDELYVCLRLLYNVVKDEAHVSLPALDRWCTDVRARFAKEEA